MSYSDMRSLVVAGEKHDVDSFNAVARKIDYRGYEIETSMTNILARLQDPSYSACFLFETIVGKAGMARLLSRLRANLQTKQIPIVIIVSAPDDTYYEEGAQLVIDKLSDTELKKALLTVDAFNRFTTQFKEGREKFFRQ